MRYSSKRCRDAASAEEQRLLRLRSTQRKRTQDLKREQKFKYQQTTSGFENFLHCRGPVRLKILPPKHAMWSLSGITECTRIRRGRALPPTLLSSLLCLPSISKNRSRTRALADFSTICCGNANRVQSLLKLYQERKIQISPLKDYTGSTSSQVVGEWINSDDIILNPSMPPRNKPIHSQCWNIRFETGRCLLRHTKYRLPTVGQCKPPNSVKGKVAALFICIPEVLCHWWEC